MDEADSQYWIYVDSALEKTDAPAASVTDRPARRMATALRSVEHPGHIRLLVVLVLFLLDTFLPWQRACVGLEAFGFHFGGCLSANAWSGSAAHAGQVAGVFAILAIGLISVRLGGIDLGEGGRLGTRVGVYGTVLAGTLKWISVLGKIASFGAWLGLLLLLAIAIMESIDRLSIT